MSSNADSTEQLIENVRALAGRLAELADAVEVGDVGPEALHGPWPWTPQWLQHHAQDGFADPSA